MVDHFQTLSLPRLPWLEAEDIKAKFHELSLVHHPDHADASGRAHAEGATSDLNSAFRVLSNTRDRLGHLLLLETGRQPSPIQQIPAAAVDLAMRAAQMAQQADKFLQAKRATTSPIMQAKLMEEGMDWSEKLDALRKQLEHRRSAIEQELRDLNPAWEMRGSTPLPLDRLEELYRTISFLQRWEQQLQERALQATF